MAKREHVEIARRGTAAIAEWRADHAHERLNLRGANLREVNLLKADLHRANLSEATLVGANLGAATLAAASLVKADVSAADLTLANLNGALLDEAILHGTSLILASLAGANLSHARCFKTSFADCDLSDVRGLGSVQHVGPSSIGVDTLVRTLQGAGGQFTAQQRTFFENAGVSRTLLDNLPFLLETQPIQFFTCFISYGGEDGEFADRLYRDLRKRGLSCWKYDVDALVGRPVWANIDEALRLHDKTIVICSQSSLQRPGVQREIERALQREDELISRQSTEPHAKIDTDVLFPVRLDDYVFDAWEHPRKPDMIAKNIGDFRGWDEDDANYQRGLDQLLRALDPRSKLGLSKGDPRELEQD